MNFYKFECDSEETSLRCIEMRSLPPHILRSGLLDKYAANIAKLVKGDAVVLGTWHEGAAKFFAVGRVIRCPTGDDPGEVAWIPTPGKSQQIGQGSDRWKGKTAFQIRRGTKSPYGIRELLMQPNIQELSAPEREAFIHLMRDEGYTESRLELAPYICDLLSRLRDEGFEVFPRGDGKAEDRGTINVFSHGHPVAYVPSGGSQNWNHLIGLSYRWPGKSKPQQEVPPDFDVVAFARAQGVESRHLELVPPGAKQRYLRITDFHTALELIHRMASFLDEDYVPPEALGRQASQEADEQSIKERYGASAPATCKRLIEARRGQGAYRAAMLKRFGGKCAVSGLGLLDALRASHVLAWRKCESDYQRLDPDNGLLLSADLDALFDKYLISFDREGRLLRSPKLEAHLGHHWPLGDLRKRPTEEQCVYLEKHKETFQRLAKLWADQRSRRVGEGRATVP